MTQLMAVDPGGATGVATGSYSDTEPLRFTDTYTIPKGVEGFSEVFWNGMDTFYPEKLIVETFVPRANEFLASVAGVEVIGFIKGTSLDTIWQDRGEKADLTGGDGQAANDAWLKEHDLWLTGKQVGWKDARDALDARIHALVYMKKIRHIPTLREYFSD